MFTRQAENSVY